jgi:3-hydroxyisobutyrate dehydrogenase/2-hydroxy-3-oxopropionate reductase
MVTSVAFLGLGAMGTPMARRLAEAGNDVVVWNRTRSRAEPLAAADARVAESPADAVRGREVAITMLRDSAALRDVAGEALPAMAPDSTLVDMSTVGPAAITELAQRVPDGVTLVDAPVLGSVPQAEDGSLRIFVGADETQFDALRPLLETLGAPLRVGPLGSGAAAKLVANSTLFAVLAGLGEAIALGDALGLAREATFEVLSATPLGEQAARRREAFETRAYPRRFALSLARKDANLVADAKRDLRLAAAARAWLADADDVRWGDLDYSALLAFIAGEEKPHS